MLAEERFIADRYEIISRVGAGGMSDVYKAKDLTLGRFVAIKILKSEFSEDLNFVTKFRTEAQSAAGLEHPNIVNIYDVGSEKGMHYIVMEFVEGVTLKTYIEKKGQLSFKEAVSIAIQVGRGIEAAHSKGIVHRDIKPQNIIISTEGKVKVTDFGIARAATANTINSDVMGSVHYSSPEQARNGFVDGKSDIYSLGIVMYEMVTGRVPFDGDTTVAVAIQHLQEEMVPPSAYALDLPISMEKIILKCTQKSPDRRYESVTALLADLRKALISPDEDFVVMTPMANRDKTRVIGEEDLHQIQREAAGVHLKPERYEEPEEEEEEPYDDEFDDEDDDGDLNPKMEKAITIMGIVAGIVIVAIIIVLLVSLFGGFKSGGNKPNETEKQNTQNTESTQSTQNDTENAEGSIKVPNLLGMTEQEARDAIKERSLGIQVKGQVSSDEYEEGEIVSQNPVDGTMVEEHTTIEVVLSSGKGSVDIPSVVGKTADEAVAELDRAGFKTSKTFSFSSTVEEGRVISQTPSGGQGKEGDTIIIEISQGQDMLTVPDLVSNYTDQQTAMTKLEGFNVTVKTAYHETYSPGLVIEQSLAAGTRVNPGSAITITVSQGPEPSQSITATTYSFQATIDTTRLDPTQVSGANLALYDANGNQVAAWPSQALSTLGTNGTKFKQTGILTETGTLEITWLDMDGNVYGKQTEAVKFTAEN